jgi:outer membrane murein-binding lipoprotein Lpp
MEANMMKQTAFIYGVAFFLAVQGVFSTPVMAEPITVDSKTIERLETLINSQQKQLEALQQEVNQLKQATTAAQSQANEAKTIADAAKATVQAPVDKVVTSGQERVKIVVSGQVNRAMNVASDGDKTKAYFVDSDASNSKLRLVGTAKVDDDLTIGSRLEIAFAPNESSKVSQDNEESGDYFDQRYADLSLESKRFGRLYLGKGDTSSNNSAEIDLSGTDVVQYASIADIVGGLKFRQSGNEELTDITVSGAFKDFDGLSRKSRLRYDTPKFHGLSLSGSVISDQRWDASLWWGGEGYGFKTGAAAAVADINEDNADYQYSGSFSILHQATGLNFTFSAGTKDNDNGSDPYNLWGKLGWQTSLTSLGKTSFGLDYGHSENISAENDEGDTFGIAVVQNFADYGTEVYLQYRNFSLDRDNTPSVSDINVGTVGARVKF